MQKTEKKRKKDLNKKSFKNILRVKKKGNAKNQHL